MKSDAETMNLWCIENISPQDYSRKHYNGVQVGGEGWELMLGGRTATAYIEDAALASFFMLAFVKELS